jgi:hypothetical protein
VPLVRTNLLPKKGSGLYNAGTSRSIGLSAPKWILVGAVALFSTIGVAALLKKGNKQLAIKSVPEKGVVETSVVSIPAKMLMQDVKDFTKKGDFKDKKSNPSACLPAELATLPLPSSKDDFPNIDRVFQLFTTGASQLPIVQTVTYSSRTPWLKGRPAWVADYATYFNTSRHFIARSLNGKPDYFSQKVFEGSKFNVFRKDKQIHFYLLVDISRCKMGFYYVDLDTNERVLLKTYRVGLGRLDAKKPSGTLTPLGRYVLGSRVAIYKPGVMGVYQDQKVEMICVFGTRWIPLEQEAEKGAISTFRGYGLQGAPWISKGALGQLVENRETIGAYDSDGCIRLSCEDMEELFAIVLPKPTFIVIVKDFHEAKLPGVEVAAPSR